jgi:TetR/AcrR family transcriptional repressor of nem operon
MQAFWAKGYEATSLTDLMEVTGLHKGSLYQAFGDKHALFIMVLKRYLGEMRRKKNELMKAAATPLDGLRAVMHGMLDFTEGDCSCPPGQCRCPKGCLAVNSLVELAPHDPEVRIVMEDHMQRMRHTAVDALMRAEEAGQIELKRSPEVVAALIMTFMAGLAARVKAGLSKVDAHDLLATQLELLT